MAKADSISKELEAAFYWTAFDKETRKVLKKNPALTLDEIIPEGKKSKGAKFSAFDTHEASRKKNFAEHLSRSLMMMTTMRD